MSEKQDAALTTCIAPRDSILGRFVSWLRKPNFHRSFVPQMEGLRFLAMLVVFFLHFDQAVTYKLHSGPTHLVFSSLQKICQVGDYGVHLFFAVSGFVLALPFARWHLGKSKAVELSPYLLRRLWRLEPPLLINLLLLLPVTVWVVGKLSFAEAVHRFFLTLFYSHYLTLGEMSPINRVSWSLETELQFYLCMPLLGMLFKLKNPIIRRSFLVILSATCIAMKPHLNMAWLPAQFEFFAAGILLADLYLTSEPTSFGKSKLWDITGCLALMAMPLIKLYYGSGKGPIESSLLVFCAFLILSSSLRGKYASKLFSGSAITLVGGMCYSFYLYHDPVLRYVGSALEPFLPRTYESRFIVEFLILTPLVAVATLFTYALFERPFMGSSSNKSSVA
ncbi:MAG: acyltransferase [Prosthecobacter sp.]|nr:acyltransferase [Prosthecobacter sp.]